MKKRTLKSLELNKRTISSFTAGKTKGGTSPILTPIILVEGGELATIIVAEPPPMESLVSCGSSSVDTCED
ncbi:hypothetical protein C8N46_1173 [Kordia periserrulae]|uniref:Uncharacterized protein n=1 Tax=Kordia periserrulae TaxID=701523 RepID=A0A2T6BQI2_9FLAO|nr:hypothetical protein [Kordia periserrulae]PTX58227.1 hypothetical protein C8N46_1173 [Kordia periserrulae]